jgi:hypothetical protein
MLPLVYHTKTKSHLWWLVRYWLVVVLLLATFLVISGISLHEFVKAGGWFLILILVWQITEGLVRRRLEKLVLDTENRRFIFYYWSVKGRGSFSLAFDEIVVEARNDFINRPARLFFIKQRKEVFQISPRKDAFTYNTLKQITVSCAAYEIRCSEANDLI